MCCDLIIALVVRSSALVTSGGNYNSCSSVDTSSLVASNAASCSMTPSRFRVAHWAFAFGLAGLAFLMQIGAAGAQFFDPFSQFFAPQAPTYAPQAPVYAPPLVSRRGPRFSRRSRDVRVSERPHIRRSH